MEVLVWIPFIVFLAFFFVIYSGGKKKYSMFINALDKKEYTFKDFMPFGFAFMDIIKYKYSNDIDRILRRQLLELYSAEYIEFYIRVVWAKAATFCMIGLIMSGLFFAATEGDTVVLVFFILLSLCTIWLTFNEIKTKIDRRHNQIAIDLPDLTNQIIILSGAGMTLKSALIKISQEIRVDTPLYQALKKACDKINNGSSDEEAMDVLNVLCNMPEVRRFTSVILQNMQRGGSEVLVVLQDIGKELWDLRKATAKKIAEETSTKLLLPMMLMLISVIVLVAAPAVIGIGI